MDLTEQQLPVVLVLLLIVGEALVVLLFMEEVLPRQRLVVLLFMEEVLPRQRLVVLPSMEEVLPRQRLVVLPSMEVHQPVHHPAVLPVHLPVPPVAVRQRIMFMSSLAVMSVLFGDSAFAWAMAGSSAAITTRIAVWNGAQ